MKVGYYPGCSLLGSSREFGESVRAVAEALEIELAEVPDWNCCGASSAHALNHLLSVALPANVLAKAAQAGFSDVVAPCASCSHRLITAQREIEGNPALRKKVEEVIDAPLDKPVRILNILELLDRASDRIAAKVTQPFNKTVACYYGCLLVRPPRVVEFDRAEDPTSMDKLVVAAGGKTIDWNFKTECCGAGFSAARSSVVVDLGKRIVQDAANRKAEAIVVACPMCHVNLDLRRAGINRALNADHGFPVLFITQVVGLALGLPPPALGLQRHFVPVMRPLLAAPSGTLATTGSPNGAPPS